MGLVRRITGAGAKKLAQSSVVHEAIGVAADAFERTGAGQTAVGRAASGIARSPEHREGAINIAAGIATPGIMNKVRAAKAAHGIVQDARRGGGGAVSRQQFSGQLPPPPGGSGNDDTPSWMGPGYVRDFPPSPRSGSQGAPGYDADGNVITPHY